MDNCSEKEGADCFKDIFAAVNDTSDPRFKDAAAALAASDEPATLLFTSQDPSMIELRERTLLAAGFYDEQLKAFIARSFGYDITKMRRLADRDPALIPKIGRWTESDEPGFGNK